MRNADDAAQAAIGQGTRKAYDSLTGACSRRRWGLK
jgi:hypothetical protein